MSTEYEKVEGFEFNEKLKDSAIHDIDLNNKTIALIGSQTLISGERNSQYIQFKVNRYYDGVDLSEKNIKILYNGSTGYHSSNLAINVMRNDEAITFGWLVPKGAILAPGELKVAIEFQNKGNNDYVLKIQPTILQVHPGMDELETDEPLEEEWYVELKNKCDAVLENAEKVVENLPVKDIQVDQNSIVSAGGTATIPYASASKAGIMRVSNGCGLSVDETGSATVNFPMKKITSHDKSIEVTEGDGTWNLQVAKYKFVENNDFKLALENKANKEKWELLNSINDMTKQEIVNGCPFMTLYRGDIPYSKFVVNVQFPKESITANATFYVKIGATKDAAINDTINLAGCALNKGCTRYNAEVRKQGNGNWKIEYSTQTAVYYGAQTGNLVNDQGNLAAMEGAKTIVVAMPYQTNITAFPEGTVMNLWGITDE